MNPLIPFRKAASISVVAVLASVAQAVNPPPDGGYSGGNTAEGQSALFSLTTGGFNTAVGWLALRSNTENGFNTAVGAGALFANISAANTATGAGALLSTTTGGNNTANGAVALFSNTIGQSNTATGAGALFANTEGINNTANGFQALLTNTIGHSNTAVGAYALLQSGDASENTAVGKDALLNHIDGCCNTALGWSSMANGTAGFNNTAVGANALINNMGNNNTALGAEAAGGVTTASNVICIASAGANEDNSCYIGNIWNQPGGTQPVYVNSEGKLGQMVSSQRFKDEIAPMDHASEIIYELEPVSFRYKPEIEPTRPLGFGLVAEEVEKVSRDLITRDADGQAQSVRYDAVNAMLLNEFLKEHKKVQRLEDTVASLAATVKEQARQIQKVSAQVEASKLMPQIVLNNRGGR